MINLVKLLLGNTHVKHLKTEKEQMKSALMDIHNQTCISPDNLENARITIECIEDILKRVEHLYTENKDAG